MATEDYVLTGKVSSGIAPTLTTHDNITDVTLTSNLDFECSVQVALYLTPPPNAEIVGPRYTPTVTSVLVPARGQRNVKLTPLNPNQPITHKIQLKCNKLGKWTKKNINAMVDRFKASIEVNSGLFQFFDNSDGGLLETYEFSNNVGVLQRHMIDGSIEFIVENMCKGPIKFKISLRISANETQDYEDLIAPQSRTRFAKCPRECGFTWVFWFENESEELNWTKEWREYSSLHPHRHHFISESDFSWIGNSTEFFQLSQKKDLFTFRDFIAAKKDNKRATLLRTVLKKAKLEDDRRNNRDIGLNSSFNTMNLKNNSSAHVEPPPSYQSVQKISEPVKPPIIPIVPQRPVHNTTRLMGAELRELKALLDEGILTKAEFDEEKREIRQKYRSISRAVASSNSEREPGGQSYVRMGNYGGEGQQPGDTGYGD